MAFSFGNSGNGAIDGTAGVETGPDLEDIQTEALGFLALSGEAKVQLLASPWPTDNLPPTTASLMSVASNKGLVAAASPDSVIVTTTESVRMAFEAPSTGDGNFKPFEPELKLPMSMRISQLAFSADESYLVLSAEVGGGLAVYEVQGLLQGSTQSAFELSTNGQALRALVPNPTPEKGELFAIVTADGNLMMANLKERNFISGPKGHVLKDGVSCLSWSTKGKQLVAGLGNGTAYQMTPEGIGKGDIPKPPGVDNNHHVSSIIWLENHVFLLVHTPSILGSNAPSSIFHVATRQSTSFMFRKIAEPAGPFGLNRSPPHHFLLRLRDFPPNLQDLIIVASTASTDIGLFSRSKVPLTFDKPADKITGVFTMTEMSDDSRRAQLPMTGDLSDTSPIGLALDLSSKEKVLKPIPSDEMEESPTPLPALMVLNNEGVLSSWWIVYSESLRQNTIYPGLVSADAATQAPNSSPSPAQPPMSNFGATGFAAPSSSGSAFAPRSTTVFGAIGAFGAPSGLGQRQSPWGTSSTSTAATSNVPVFGSSTFSSKNPASMTTQAFVPPTFGVPSNPAFGNSSILGNPSSPWGSASSATQGPAFGLPAGLGKAASFFGSAAPNVGTMAPSSGGFASFATKGGFAAAGSAPPATGSIFGPKPTSNAFSPPGSTSAMGANTTFIGTANKVEEKSTDMFGSGSNFVVGSTFKADSLANYDGPEPSGEAKSSFFASDFGISLGEATRTSVAAIPGSTEAEMDSTEELPKLEEPGILDSTTPVSTSASTKPNLFTTAPPAIAGLFGTSSPAASLPSITKDATSTTFSFGKVASDVPSVVASSFGNLNRNATMTSKPLTPTISTSFSFRKPTADVPDPGAFSFGSLGISAATSQPLISPSQNPTVATSALSPNIKEEPSTGGETGVRGTNIAEAPVPPESTSKTSYAAADASVSSTETDAPLPPDFIPKAVPRPAPPKPLQSHPSPVAKKILTTTTPPTLNYTTDVPEGPDDDHDDSDFGSEEDDCDESEAASEEGSGEDVAKDLSPTSETKQTPGFTPQSSFAGLNNRNPDSSLFAKVQKPSQANQSRSLFGEINSSAPTLPPPKVQASPRSPSPIRTALPGRMLRPDASRSVSAPGVASQILGSRRSAIASQSTVPLSLEQQVVDEQRRAKTRARKDAEEKQALVDDEDEMMQKFLSSDLVATRTLDEFVAHADYFGPPSMDSIPAQVETVYRDINSMIDTLGLNARALKCFIKGHTEHYKDDVRTRQDLEDDEDWCLVEIENLSSLVEKTLARELEGGRVKEVASKLETGNDIQKDLVRLRAKHEDIKKVLATYSDPRQLTVSRAQPLSAEQAAQQHDLRRDFIKFQKLLSEAEEGLSVLNAKISSLPASNGKSNGPPGPTVEAVMRTITKMTGMAEKRSGDIDVLEGQMRKLRFNSAASTDSREGSPFATPQNIRASLRNPGTSSTHGLFYTPDSIKDNSRGFQNSLMSSTSSRTRSSPPKKKISGYSAEEKAQLMIKLERKKDVTDRLRAALQKAGTNVRLMDDE